MNISSLFIRHQNFFKNLIIIKIAVIAVFALYYSNVFFVGEKSLNASDEAKTDAPSVQEKSTAENDPVKSTEDPGKKAEEVSPGEEKSAEKAPRRTFLEGLLDLPDLNRDKIKKDELGKYLNLAEQKRQQVEIRLSVLKEQETNLLALEKKVEGKIKNLEEDRRYYAETIQKEKDLKGERLAKLVSLYKKMEPKKAAQVFEAMDRDLVVALFIELPEKQTMKILELMTPEKSTQLSEYFGRVRSGKEYELLKEINTSLVKEFAVCKGYKGDLLTKSQDE